MHAKILILLAFLSISASCLAQEQFIYPFKVGDYFEYDFIGSNFSSRYSAKITGEIFISGRKFAVMQVYNEPAMGNHTEYYRVDSATLNIYSTSPLCPDSTGFFPVAGFNMPVGFAWNDCDTTEPYFRSRITDTVSGPFFNTGTNLRSVTRKDTIIGIIISGSSEHVYMEKFGYYSSYFSSGSPFGGSYAKQLKGAIIDGITYGTITLNLNQISSEIPAGYLLKQNFPNPFNPSTVI